MLTEEFGFSVKDIDDVKQIVTRTSLAMLSLTYFVLFMHMLFDFLAFKSDIGFWHARETIEGCLNPDFTPISLHFNSNLAPLEPDFTPIEGLSSRSVIGNFLCNIVIFIHLYDSGFTSIIVLISAGVSAVIEAWKVFKVLKIRVTRKGWQILIHRDSKSNAEELTDAHDAAAMNAMGKCIYPMVVGGAVYSLVFMTHRSYISWLITSAAHGVYTMGFVLMTPQLFINYKVRIY